MTTPKLILTGLRFPEGSRWHDGQLYFSDMHTGQVLSFDPETEVLTEIAHIDGQPSGIGWAENGDLLVSSMLDNRVIRINPDGVQTIWADASSLNDWPTNELWVSEDGHGYLGNFGYDFYNEAPAEPGTVFHITPNGEVSVAATGFTFPNGTVILPGTNTLIVAETWGHQLTAFDIAEDGSLENRRIWASLWPESTADGITADTHGGVWISSIAEKIFARVVKGGKVTHRIDMGDELAVDCAFGGTDGKTLFLSTSNSWQPAETIVREGKVYTLHVNLSDTAE